MFTSKIVYQGNLRNTLTHLKSGVEITTDAPIDNHGLGSAFSPTDLCATSLASCMMTIIAIACQARNLNIQSMESSIIKLMGENPRKISEIIVNLDIKIEGINENQKEILINAGLNCPVALSLNPEIKQNINISFL